jgi:hypothetical protein
MSKKIILIWMTFLFSFNALYGQSFEVKQESYTIRSHYGYSAKRIDSLAQLPEKIKLTLKLMLIERLGRNIYEKLTFEDGQVVDLDNYFSSSLPSHRMIPKYDLIFVLSDTTLGIQAYYLNVDLDSYGQLLSINWPSKRVEEYEFASIKELHDFALQYGKKHKFNTKSMYVNLEYEKATDKLYWWITYKESFKDKGDYSDQIIKLHLSSLKLIGEYYSPNKAVH